MKNLKLLFLLLLPLLLVGCINYSEEAWLNADGSGKISMEISTSQQLIALMSQQGNGNPFSQEEVAKPFTGVKGIKLGEVKSYPKDGNQVAVVNFEFSSLQALQSVKDGNGAPGFLGKISFTKNKKGQLIFSREIEKMKLGNTADAEQTDSDSDLAGQMSAAMLAGYNWKYKVHFPASVVSANTAKENIDARTNTVVWEIPLSSIAQGSQTMTATIKAPFPWLTMIIIVAALFVIAALVLVIFKLTQKPAVA
jgi:hypothetical protein